MLSKKELIDPRENKIHFTGNLESDYNKNTLKSLKLSLVGPGFETSNTSITHA